MKKRNERKYNLLFGSLRNAPGAIMDTFSVRNKFDCGVQCRTWKMCQGANFRSTDRTCILYNSNSDLSDLVSDPDWLYLDFE